MAHMDHASMFESFTTIRLALLSPMADGRKCLTLVKIYYSGEICKTTMVKNNDQLAMNINEKQRILIKKQWKGMKNNEQQWKTISCNEK